MTPIPSLLNVAVVAQLVLPVGPQAAPALPTPASRETDTQEQQRARAAAAFREADQRCLQRRRELFGEPPPDRPNSASDRDEKKSSIEQPRKTKNVSPQFPDRATKASCLYPALVVLISPSGDVVDLWPVRRAPKAAACPEFEEALAAAVRQWKYTPAYVDGEAVPLCMSLTVNIDVR